MPDAAVQNVWLLNRSTSSHDNEPMDLLICKEIVNIYRVKYSPQQRIHIFSPTDVTLFRSNLMKKSGFRKLILMTPGIIHLAV